MDAFLIGVGSSVAAAVVIATLRGWRDSLHVLPGRSRTRQRYDQLAGPWHFYYVTRDSQVSAQPFWIHGTQELRVHRRRFLRGLERIAEHPSGARENNVRGEVRHGRLFFADANRADDSEFASVIYPNLRHADSLVGIWSGFDNDLHPIAAPIVMSRARRTADQLAHDVATSGLHFASQSQYQLYQPDASEVQAQDG
jgi:hypothetical protein